MPDDSPPLPPLCFVVMPFGTKQTSTGNWVDFDQQYRDLIEPAIDRAGLQALRGDHEQGGGIIHKPMFERLVLADYVVADLTLANANVYYELGIRHAFRPHTTVLLFEEGSRLPFDVAPLRAIPYAGHADDDREAADLVSLTAALEQAREASVDSPVFQLLDGLDMPDISRLRTDVFRDQVSYSMAVKRRLADARSAESRDLVDEVRADLGPLVDVEAGVLVDLLLSYRAVGAWDPMLDLVEQVPEPVARSILVQEQLGFALNRAGRDDEAEQVLERILAERGPSSETLGILGRVHKDRWRAAREAGRDMAAEGHRRRALEVYLRGFEADWRDAYPGINALTMMAVGSEPDPRRDELLPVVTYAARRRVASGESDYWDHATLLEAAVLARDREAAVIAMQDALALVLEPWQPVTTLGNLHDIAEARRSRDDQPAWADEVAEELARLVPPDDADA